MRISVFLSCVFYACASTAPVLPTVATVDVTERAEPALEPPEEHVSSLPDSVRDDVNLLLHATEFKVLATMGSESSQVRALRRLVAEPFAEEALDVLWASGHAPAQLYALVGEWRVRPERYAAEVRHMRDDRREVAVQQGCEVFTHQVRDFVPVECSTERGQVDLHQLSCRTTAECRQVFPALAIRMLEGAAMDSMWCAIPEEEWSSLVVPAHGPAR